MKNYVGFVSFLAVMMLNQGCSKLFGGLRHDFDDGYRNQVTTGGVWPERQMLDEQDLETPSAYDDYRAVGHNERAPAGNWTSTDPSRSWVRSPQNGGVERIRSAEELAQNDERMLQSRGQNTQNRFKNGVRATRADFLDESQNEGSLWASGGQTNYFFTKNSVKSKGDIISVTVQDPFVKDVALEAKRGLTEEEMEAEIERTKKEKVRGLASADGAGQSAGTGTGDAVKSSASSAADPTKASDPFAGEEFKLTEADVDLSKSLGLKSGETIMAEIVERYPSGNYKIRGTKRLSLNGQIRMLTFVAIARANDINEADTIESSKLYEYKLMVQR